MGGLWATAITKNNSMVNISCQMEEIAGDFTRNQKKKKKKIFLEREKQRKWEKNGKVGYSWKFWILPEIFLQLLKRYSIENFKTNRMVYVWSAARIWKWVNQTWQPIKTCGSTDFLRFAPQFQDFPECWCSNCWKVFGSPWNSLQNKLSWTRGTIFVMTNQQKQKIIGTKKLQFSRFAPSFRGIADRNG